MDNEIHWKDIKVGEQYQYEEKYDLQTVVTVLEDISDDASYRYKLRVDEFVNGLCQPLPVGYVMNVGRTKDPEYYDCYLLNGVKFKPVGSLFDYWFGK